MACVLKKFCLVHMYVVLLTGCFTRGKTLKNSNPVTHEKEAGTLKLPLPPTTQYAKDQTSSESASPTTTTPKTPSSLYPMVYINKTYWNCSNIKLKGSKTHHPNTSVYVYYTDSDPYVCNLNPLHCKRPKPPHGGHQNSLTVYPKYGDYSYLPISQWILLLQHGAVAFLYHPCTSQENIAKLRNIARKCMRRHIITPYEHLNITQPIAMVAWASFYADRYVNETASENWIKSNAMKGPASYVLLDGNYEIGLVQHARVVSDASDSELCPKTVKTPLKSTNQEKDIAILLQHYNAIHKDGHSSKKLKKQLIQNLKKQLKPEKRHINTGQAAWAVASLLFLCLVLLLVLVYTKPWNERDYYLKEKIASRNNNSNFSMLKSHFRRGSRSWRELAAQQKHASASRRLLGPIHEEEEDFMDL